MTSYYQLFKPVENSSSEYKTSNNSDIEASFFQTTDGENYFAFAFSPEKTDIFDETVKNINANYFLFANYNFEKLLLFARDKNYKVRHIEAIYSNEDEESTLEDFLLNKQYLDAADFIKNNKIMVTSIELFVNGVVIRFYDSGIIWSNSDLSSSIEVQSAVKEILNAVD